MTDPKRGKSSVTKNIIIGVPKGGTAIRMETVDEVETDGNLLADIAGNGIVLKNPLKSKNDEGSADKDWYERPLGIVFLGVATAVVAAAAIAIWKHFVN